MEGKVYALEHQGQNFIAVYESLQPSLFSDGQVWWFGWHMLKMEIPQPLDSVNMLSSEPWDHLRVFSSKAELRLGLRANKPCILLLTETSSVNLSGWREIGGYEAEDTYRILLGEAPKSAEGPVAQLIEIAYPRPFDYKLAVPQNQIVIAHVKHYRDEEWRLCYTRYCCIETQKRQKVEVKPYASL
jgi:hypothetical protein